VTHKYPAKMSCAVNNNTYGMCDGLGTCQPLSNYSCPESCERNIIVGCHNYTLNDTHPCTDETLCNYYITLLACADDLVCLNRNNSNSNSNKVVKVHFRNCVYTEPYVNNTVEASWVSCPGGVSFEEDFNLTAFKPHRVPEINGFPEEPTFLEYSPGIFWEHVNSLPVYGNQTATCFAYWHSPASQPYCSYECFTNSNVFRSWSPLPVCDETGTNCTVQVKILQISEIVTYNPPINPPNNNNTENHSDGYTPSFNLQFLLVVIIANLLLN